MYSMRINWYSIDFSKINEIISRSTAKNYKELIARAQRVPDKKENQAMKI